VILDTGCNDPKLRKAYQVKQVLMAIEKLEDDHEYKKVLKSKFFQPVLPVGGPICP
jgi:hypothetical protein